MPRDYVKAGRLGGKAGSVKDKRKAGKLGGAVASEAQKEAARRNGKRYGGRPKMPDSKISIWAKYKRKSRKKRK